MASSMSEECSDEALEGEVSSPSQESSEPHTSSGQHIPASSSSDLSPQEEGALGSDSESQAADSESASPEVVTYDAQGRRVVKRHRPGTREAANKRANSGNQHDGSPDSGGAGERGSRQSEDESDGHREARAVEAEQRARAEAVRAAATAAAMADYFEGGEPCSDEGSDGEENFAEPRPTRWRQRTAAAYDQYKEQRPWLAREMLRAHAVPEGCKNRVLQGCPAFVQLGFWPGTVAKLRTVYEIGMLEHWATASKAMPGSSLSAFVGVLEETGRRQGRDAPINRHTMSLAFGEFKFARFELKYLNAHRSGLDCPACHRHPHSCMCDGNHKLYRWDRAYEVFRQCYYGDLLLYSDADVQQSLAHLDLAMGSRPRDTCCGTGEWKAARDSKSAIRGQAETGCVLCGCRHQFAMKGVNMQYSGERYGYAYFLDRHFLQQKGVKFIYQDIICKYFPWREKVREKMGHGDGGGIRPALNLMHGKLHSWECQVLFGGLWQDGAGAGSGEDMELLFSYLSRLGIITKLMGAARRAEAITEAALYYNEEKLRHLAQSLARRYEECLKRLGDAAVALETACRDILGVPAGEVPLEQFEEWKAGVQEAARRKLDRTLHQRSDGVEYFALYTELELARGLEEIADSESFSDGALCSEKVQSVQQLTAEMLKDRASKEKKLLDLGKKVFGADYVERRGSPEQERFLREARVQLAEETIQQLQIDLEAQLHSLERYKLRVSKEADSAKMRASLRRKEGEIKKQIVAAVGRYNRLLDLQISPKERDRADADSLLAGEELPWSFEGCVDPSFRVGVSMHRTVEFRKQLELLDAYNRLRRLEEEELLLRAERDNYLTYYTELVASLDMQIAEAQESVRRAGTTPRPTFEAVAQSGRYVAPATLLWSDQDASSGFLAILSAARFEALKYLRLGRIQFGQETSTRAAGNESDDVYAEVDPEGLPTGLGAAPEPEASWSENVVSPLRIWLLARNLDGHLPPEVIESLNLDDLKWMTNTDLVHLGMSLGARLRFLDAIKTLA
ncbi:hypothetical protein KFL_004820030 [Klebsormidium nitens]|uniref:CxC3 like cysteine cluster domain-containing protein n=1 Tax=Klebsormidium nitens TaxID=105231 RepID=A0A1Y1IEK8_KLENI|nr:hypothetical protein KFL_004820030 [Klebsormidium nitens]|eukprot:GAQ89043.1 hypothetical protein KFL_004820030 [Klebsormidium nitens]